MLALKFLTLNTVPICTMVKLTPMQHVGEGLRLVDGKADEKNVGVRIREWPQSIVLLLEHFNYVSRPIYDLKFFSDVRNVLHSTEGFTDLN